MLCPGCYDEIITGILIGKAIGVQAAGYIKTGGPLQGFLFKRGYVWDIDSHGRAKLGRKVKAERRNLKGKTKASLRVHDPIVIYYVISSGARNDIVGLKMSQ